MNSKVIDEGLLQQVSFTQLACGGMRVLEDTIRLMFDGILAGAILSWVTIISELSSTIVLYPPGWSTMIVEMFQGVISDDMGTASAFAAILILSTIIPLVFITRYLRGEQTSIL